MSSRARRGSKHRGRLILAIIGVAILALGTACASAGDEAGGGASASTTFASQPSSESLQTLADGPVTPGRYDVMPPAEGWAECPDWLDPCPAEPPQARSLTMDVTIPSGWEAAMGATVLTPVGFADGASEAPDGAGLVIGWTPPFAGLYDDPCQPQSHLEPDIKPGPTVEEFVAAVVAHPKLDITEPVDVELGGYQGLYFELTNPSDISKCYDWRPFEPGIYAQGDDNLWSVWVMDVDGFRFVLVTEEFPGTPARVSAQLRSMVDSITFQP